MSRKYMEDSCDDVLNYLDAHLNTMLATIEAERGVQIPRLGTLVEGESFSVKTPLLEILPSNTDHDYSEQTGLMPDTPWLIHHILVWITHIGSSLEDIKNVLMRYTEAINRLQESDTRFDRKFVYVTLGSEDYSPMMQDQKSKKMKQAVSIELVCRTI